MTPKIIGISGIAGAGKDLFCQLLQSINPNIKRFALADPLKRELKDFIFNMYNLDIDTCSREEKNRIRPILVAHGKIRRDIGKGRHWTGITSKLINNLFENNPEAIACVTDIRYDVYDDDEVTWLRNEMKGVLVHLSKYTLDANGNKVFGTPPNQDEFENDPKLKAKADYLIEWPQAIGVEDNDNTIDLKSYAENFLEFLQKQDR